MSAVAEVLESLRHAVDLPEIAEGINALLNDERVRRERFYDDITPDMKAEFIDGEMIVHSPVRRGHLTASDNLSSLVQTWIRPRRLGELHVEKCLCVFPRNDYEPDIVFFSAKQMARFTKDTMKFPVPAFVVEILSESTEQRDRNIKFQDYQRHGVREYWIIDPILETVEQYLVRGKRFELKLKSDSGEIASPTITGFRIPIRAIFDVELCATTAAALAGK